jgi:hypothetical protein
MTLEQLLARHPALWRGRGPDHAAPPGVPTGFAPLDRALPWGGWPPGSLSEILTDHPGAALGLTLPMLAALSRRPRWLLLVDPPLVPFAPALSAHGVDLRRLVIVRSDHETGWAMEQALRSGACAAVLGWYHRDRRRDWPDGALRRLQLAADAGRATGILLREPEAAGRPSPAALRLRAEAAGTAIVVTLLKQRGGCPGIRLSLDASPVASIARSGRAATRSGAFGNGGTGPCALLQRPLERDGDR